MAIAHILTDTSVTVVINYTPKIIDSKHPNFKQVLEALGNPATTEQDLIPLLDIPTAIKNFTGSAVYVKDGKLYYEGCEVRTSLGRTIMKFVQSGQPELAEPLKLFLANVQQNPDPRAINGLFDWVQAAGLPITGDGYVLAWKAVTADYRSIHTPGDPRFDHRIGNRVEQPRDECNADPSITCSSGLHFCAASYLSSYARGGYRVVVVKIHPKDVVSFPTDYNLAKGRACGYDIVGEVPIDKVPDYYPQSPVYRGFDSVAKAKPVKTHPQGVKPEIGQVYRRRDGSTVVIVRREGTVVMDHKNVAYMSNDGSKDEISKGGRQRPHDLVEAISFDLTRDDFEVGQVWINRSGKRVTVTSIETHYLNTSNGTLWAENGRTYRDRASSSVSDLVFRVDYKPVVKAPRLGKFAVGQVWEMRNGQVTTITSVTEAGGYPIRASNGAGYHLIHSTDRTAFYNAPREGTSAIDLVRMVKDVK